MEIANDYFINEKTVLIMGENLNGKLFTRVIEGEKTLMVTMSPNRLINKTLLHLGSDLRGAIESSKELLGPLKMYPIKVNVHKGIWLFPSSSMKNENCIWFSLLHVKDTQSMGIRKTKVLFSFGHSIIIEMKESSFINKCQKAKQLREVITKNIKGKITFYLEQREGFIIIKDPVLNNYRVIKRNK